MKRLRFLRFVAKALGLGEIIVATGNKGRDVQVKFDADHETAWKVGRHLLESVASHLSRQRRRHLAQQVGKQALKVIDQSGPSHG